MYHGGEDEHKEDNSLKGCEMMRTVFEAALTAVAIICGVMWRSTDLAMKGLLLLYKEKGYMAPTKQEIDACIDKVAKMKNLRHFAEIGVFYES